MICDTCQRMISQPLISFHGKKICEHCFDDLTAICNNCDERHFIVNMYTTNTRRKIPAVYLCSTCRLDNNFSICHSCGKIISKEDVFLNASEIEYCETCYNSIYRQCSGCGMEITRLGAIGYCHYCKDCFDERYFYCDDCDNLFLRTNDECYDGLCASCYHRNNSIIKCYDFKPDPIFFGNKMVKDRNYSEKKLFFGFELEVENYSTTYEHEEIARDIHDNVNEKLFYYKEDDSLDCGFEVISHPMNFHYIKNDGKKYITAMLKKLRDNDCKSYNTETCGMHVHITKSYIGNLMIYKILKFFYENQKFIVKISTRKFNNLEKYATLNDKNDNRSIITKAKSKSSNRYVAVNLINNGTLEIRIFRGTLNERSFYRNLEFCHALIMFNEKHSIKDININKFSNFITLERKMYSNLYQWLRKYNYIK